MTTTKYDLLCRELDAIPPEISKYMAQLASASEGAAKLLNEKIDALESRKAHLTRTLTALRLEGATQRTAAFKAVGEKEDARKHALDKKIIPPTCEVCGSNEYMKRRMEVAQPIFRSGCSWQTPPTSVYDWYVEFCCYSGDIRCLKIIPVYPELPAAKVERKMPKGQTPGHLLTSTDSASSHGGL